MLPNESSCIPTAKGPDAPDESLNEWRANTSGVQARKRPAPADAQGVCTSPAIFDATQLSEREAMTSLKAAASMGFNTLLVSAPTKDLINATHEQNLAVFSSIDLAATMKDEVIAYEQSSHNASDTALKTHMETLIELGIAGFICWRATDVEPFDLSDIINRAHEVDKRISFIASTFGATNEQILALRGAGFNFTISSSCWWNFKDGWLNGDSERIDQLAPPIALANLPGSAFPKLEMVRRRALTLASIFGSGWIMPAGFELGETYNIDSYVRHLNEFRNSRDFLKTEPPAKVISSPGVKIAVIERGKNLLLAANSSLDTSIEFNPGIYAPILSDFGVSWKSADGHQTDESIQLAPAESRIFEFDPQSPIFIQTPESPNCDSPRIAIEAISPKVDDGKFPVRRIIAEIITVEADIITDGHDKLAAEILYKPVTDEAWQSAPMELIGNNRWRGNISLPRLGRYIYAIRAWRDRYASLADEVTKKHNAGLDIKLEIVECLELVEKTADANHNGARTPLLRLLKDSFNFSTKEKLDFFLSKETAKWMKLGDIRAFSVQTSHVVIDAERRAATYSSWYEIFPRSQSGTERHGTFQDVITNLPRIANMGFDVLYFPPIHPIGHKNRKGKNNTLTPSKSDPGSPYAIGSEDGGHDAIHPALGDINDFRALIEAAKSHGLEIALDFAIQCAPDHPWLRQHPEWFDWRSDGSLRYAENPPKKYEDIVNVDFYAEGAKPSLWIALRNIVQYWVDQGIRIFRVDNPHTKPLPFWEWMINDIRGRHPETIFLAEAFTTPKLMYRLAKIGFSQSYTYFTWRNTKTELQNYLIELTTSEVKEFFRPHFFVNTPDINPEFLQRAGRPGFLIRAALAATLSGLWGVYNGFELCEANAVPGKEEYLDSEKYEIKLWNYHAAGNIIPEIKRLNEIRRVNFALQTHLNVEFHNAQDEQVIFYSKEASDGNILFVVVCLDPFNTHETTIELPLWRFGIPDDGHLEAKDLMRDFEFTWHGKYQPVTLHPDQPFCIWQIGMPGA